MFLYYVSLLHKVYAFDFILPIKKKKKKILRHIIFFIFCW